MRSSEGHGLLSGIRVIDFTTNLAGPYATRFLGMLGAEVIRIEHGKRLDVLRRRSESDFNATNLGKMSITLDLKSEKGIDLAKRLIKISDVVVESFRPGVMAELGLGYGAVREVKPEALMVSLSGFGATGPERNFASWASIFAAMSGVSYITGYPDSIATEFRGSFDTRAGQMVALAVMIGLVYCRRTGLGQHIDISAIESQICSIGEVVMDYTMNGRICERAGNRHPYMAPHNAYRCLGEDCWVSIAVGNDAEWRALCDAMGRPELSREERFKDLLSRWENQEALDEIITSWTSDRTGYEVMEILQKVGVAAIPVLSAPEIFSDPHLQERRFVQEVEHPQIGKRFVFGPPWQIEGEAAEGVKRGPLLGEHNNYVFHDLLSLSTEEILHLKEEKVIS
jgi:benzylsuccinate CoA-transferase BbsF subunit